MVRTETVNLTVIEGIAYRQKLPAGGAGVVILRAGSAQPGIASISKTSGEAIPTVNTPADLYPAEAFAEAIALTAGLPYRKRSAPAAPNAPAAEAEETPEIEAAEVVVDSADYEKIVAAYTDKGGKLSYALLNKDLIQFVHSSALAQGMIAEKVDAETICLYAVGSKFRAITGNPDLTNEQLKKIIELLDEVSPKGVLTEFALELRKALQK